MTTPTLTSFQRKFVDPNLERDYLEAARAINVASRRWYLGLGLIMVASFVALDVAVLGGTWNVRAGISSRSWDALVDWQRSSAPAVEQRFAELLVIRAAFFCIVTVALLCTFIKRIWKHEEAILGMTGFLSIAAILSLMYVAGYRAVPYYYDGLGLVIMFAAFLFQVSVAWLTAIGSFALLAYNVLFWWLMVNVPGAAGADLIFWSIHKPYVAFNNNLFLISFLVIALVANRKYQATGRYVYWQMSRLRLKDSRLRNRNRKVMRLERNLSELGVPRMDSVSLPINGPSSGDRPLRTNVFISYSHDDEEWLRRLKIQLRPLLRGREQQVWDDFAIDAGDDWREQIQHALSEAKVAVFLVSSNFLASDFIWQEEWKPIMESQPNVRVLWLLLDASHWQTAGFENIQAAYRPLRRLDGLAPDEQNAILHEVSLTIVKHLDG